MSAGVKEIILEILKLLNIKGLEDYIKRKRIIMNLYLMKIVYVLILIKI